jgi:hypothetical protein
MSLTIRMIARRAGNAGSVPRIDISWQFVTQAIGNVRMGAAGNQIGGGMAPMAVQRTPIGVSFAIFQTGTILASGAAVRSR